MIIKKQERLTLKYLQNLVFKKKPLNGQGKNFIKEITNMNKYQAKKKKF